MKKYALMFGHLGNGLTVFNTLEEIHGDYKTVAHIAQDRTVKFYDNNLPTEIKEKILHVAKTNNSNISATQEQKIFKEV